jgi:two-component system LytT family sensor kinase
MHGSKRFGRGFADQIFSYIAIVVAGHAYEYLKRLRREERERYEYQQALVASELHSLKAQLRPHFLFKTLHRIATLVDGDSKNAHAMIIKLSDLLRTALDSDSADLISLQDELKFVREYLDLEKMRFGRRLQIEWLVAPATKSAVGTADDPSTVNRERNPAWRFLCSRRRMGRCGCESKRRNSRNPGAQQRCGKSSSGTGVGPRNTEARLKYLYSGDPHLRLTVSDDRTATVSLTLPALHAPPASTERPFGRTVH